MTNPAVPDRKRGVFVAEALANETLCDQHYLLTMRIEGFSPSQPGQFIQLQCRPMEPLVSARPVDWPAKGLPRPTQPELAGTEPMLRRPLSLAARRDTAGSCELDIIYRAIGTGTTWLAGVEAGAKLSVLGPLGNSFAIGDGPLAALVGGGVGIPPMIYLASALGNAGKKVVAFCGTRSANLLPVAPARGPEPSASGEPTACLEQFAAFGADSVVATDDGSAGYPGQVSDAFSRWLVSLDIDPEDLSVYACGPEPMMQAVGEICIRRGVPCQLALERHMACGMGTCQSCVVKIRDETESGFTYKLCCTDGPVFDARQIIWH